MNAQPKQGRDMNEEQKRHRKIKLILKIAGLIVVLGGLALVITGFVDLFTSDGFPSLFWCLIIGLPALGIGGGICLTAFRREIASYTARESAPVFNQTAKEIRPGIGAIAEAAKASAKTLVCPACGAHNDGDAKFCDSCGKPLIKVCPFCGAQADADAKFCDNCGKQLQQEEPPADDPALH